MATLTFAPDQFEGPEQAYRKVQKARSVARFVQWLEKKGLAETREFFYAIEFHKSGWVHYHVAFRAGDLDPELLGVRLYPDSNEIAAKWKHGLIEFSKPPEGDRYEPEHAMNYLTKYVAKQDVKAPDWVLDSTRRFRKFSTSHELCGPAKPRVEPKKKRKPYPQSTPRERAERCATKSRLMEVIKTEIISPDGEVVDEKRKYRFLHDVDYDFRFLRRNHKAAYEPDELRAWCMIQLMLNNKFWDCRHLNDGLSAWDVASEDVRRRLREEYEKTGLDYDTAQVLDMGADWSLIARSPPDIPRDRKPDSMAFSLPDPAGVCVNDPRPVPAPF